MGFHVIWFLKQTMQLLFISAREFLSFFFILLPPFRFRLLSFKCLQCWKNFSLSLRGNFWLVPRWRAEVWRHLKGLRIWRKGSIWKLQMKFCLLCGTSFVIYLPSLCFFFSALPKVKLRLLLTLQDCIYMIKQFNLVTLISNASIISGMIFSPLTSLIMTMANSTLIVILWPIQTFWTYYCILRCYL